MNGLILVHKPQNLTSHDVVDSIRKALHVRKVGHFGTLDPLATGLLLVAVGNATRFFPFFSKFHKVYTGEIRLGFSTDTYDSTGSPSSAEKRIFPDESTLTNIMKDFEGEGIQNPPLFSAKKFKGKPLYSFARQNKKIAIRPQKVHIHSFKLLSYTPPLLEFEAKCSSGTYIRSLAHDLGERTQCGAHLSKLIRVQVGDFHLNDSFSLEKIRLLSQQGKSSEFMIPLEALLSDFPKITVKKAEAFLAKNGNTIFPENMAEALPSRRKSADSNTVKSEKIFKLFSPEGRFLALARQSPEGNGLHPFLVIDTQND